MTQETENLVLEILKDIQQRLGRLESRFETIETRLENVETRLENVLTRLTSLEGRMREVEIQLSSMVRITGSMFESFQMTAQQHDARLDHLETLTP